MTSKRYVAFITVDCYPEKPNIRTRTYLIPTTPNEIKGEILCISDLAKIWTGRENQIIDLSVEDICKLILANIPIDEISNIVVESFGVGLAIYECMQQIVQDESLDISVEEIRNIKHI